MVEEEQEINQEELKDEIESRRDILEDEMDDSDYDEITINEILRDEFSDPKYEDALIELGINDTDLGLIENPIDDDTISKGDSGDKDNMVSILMNPKPHIRDIELTLMGFEEENGKRVKKRRYLIPRSDINSIVELLRALFLPQNLSAKLHTDITYFDDTMNSFVNNLRKRLTDYKDDIVSGSDMRIAIDMVLANILVVRNAIKSGRLGDITRDMAIGSYNEKVDNSKPDRLDEMKKRLTG